MTALDESRRSLNSLFVLQYFLALFSSLPLRLVPGLINRCCHPAIIPSSPTTVHPVARVQTRSLRLVVLEPDDHTHNSSLLILADERQDDSSDGGTGSCSCPRFSRAGSLCCFEFLFKLFLRFAPVTAKCWDEIWSPRLFNPFQISLPIVPSFNFSPLLWNMFVIDFVYRVIFHRVSPRAGLDS